MRLEKRVVIEETDISALHAELSEILEQFAVVASFDAAEEYPLLTKLRRLSESMVISEQKTRVLESLGGHLPDDPLQRAKVLRFALLSGDEKAKLRPRDPPNLGGG